MVSKSVLNKLPVFAKEDWKYFFVLGIPREKLTRYKTGGILVSLLGVYAILWSGSAENLAGILFSLFAVLIWSVSSVLVRKNSQKYDSLLITWIAIGMAVILNMPVGMGELYVNRSVIHVDMFCICGLSRCCIFRRKDKGFIPAWRVIYCLRYGDQSACTGCEASITPAVIAAAAFSSQIPEASLRC